jgi:hypothetical protein
VHAGGRIGVSAPGFWDPMSWRFTLALTPSVAPRGGDRDFSAYMTNITPEQNVLMFQRWSLAAGTHTIYLLGSHDGSANATTEDPFFAAAFIAAKEVKK